jgi:hypothetical protein
MKPLKAKKEAAKLTKPAPDAFDVRFRFHGQLVAPVPKMAGIIGWIPAKAPEPGDEFFGVDGDIKAILASMGHEGAA